MLAVPVRLKVGSRKPEWGTNRLTSCPAKDPLDRRLQNLRDRERIPEPQRSLRPGVQKDSREHGQVPEVSDPQACGAGAGWRPGRLPGLSLAACLLLNQLGKLYLFP
nr:putative uncharacterized protein ZNF436-AS1 isoform X1 [Pan troglodytes]